LIIFTNNTDFAETIIDHAPKWAKNDIQQDQESIRFLNTAIFQQQTIYKTKLKIYNPWEYLLITDFSISSQYDILIELSKSVRLPDKILCLSGTGERFHGQKNRKWVTLRGNIHLSVLLAPNQIVDQFHSGAILLSPISVIQTIDSINSIQKKAQIKWINDVVIEEKKVCGAIAHSQTSGKIIKMIILGIGLNVETTPQILHDKFSLGTACLHDYSNNLKDCSLPIVFKHLIYYLHQNYKKLLTNCYEELLKNYRKQSMVIGKKVKVFSDETGKEIVSGKVLDIGNNLELIIKNYCDAVNKGRIVLVE
jgi:BirA family biotin operon repressor/biotin-[acetyl-CoA-carboxylase] ligase|tara:strand:+ start:200 stop:1123 length:924 start_codon:yes stop_codon:yes gene_type:complete